MLGPAAILVAGGGAVAAAFGEQRGQGLRAGLCDALRMLPLSALSVVGAPLSQTIYGMILMNAIRAAPDSASAWFRIGLGVGGGLVIGSTAWVQGRLGVHAADAFGASGKDFAAHMMVPGVIETVALFMLVFGMRAVA